LIKSSLNAWSAGVQQLSCSGCFAAAGSGAKATMPMAESSIRLLRCDRAIRRPRAGAPGQVAQAVQPPASLVAVASACLQAVQANAKCMQALCRLARCLTIQSTGHAPASWVMPVISNVRHLPQLVAVKGTFSASPALLRLAIAFEKWLYMESTSIHKRLHVHTCGYMQSINLMPISG